MRDSVRAWVLDLIAIVIGTALVAMGLVLFTIPNDIAPGGVSGLATALAYVSPLSVGVWTLLLNVPVVAVAWRKLGLKPILKTLLSTLLLSLLIDVFTALIPPYLNNVLLAAVLGGVLCGMGTGLIFLRGASTGGTDLISLLLNRVFPNMSVGFLLLLVDTLVVVFAVAVFKDIEVALYSIVTIFVTTKTIDAILQGVDHAKVIYVITEKGEAVNRRLTAEMERGVTMLEGKGGYTRRDKQVLMVVVRRNLFSQAMSAIKETDQDAFLFVVNASEVHGEGFKQ